MAFNHELLSTQRLRNLARRFPLPSALVAAVTAWTRQMAPASLIVSDQGGTVQGREPVFSPDVLAFVSQPDPVFAEHGFIRPHAARTGKSHEPDPALPVNLSFRLRHLFGPGGWELLQRAGTECSAREAPRAGLSHSSRRSSQGRWRARCQATAISP